MNLFNWLVGGLISFLALILLGCFGFIAYDIADTAGLPKRIEPAKVVSRHYKAPHVTVVSNGKTTTTVHHPARWSVKLAGDGCVGNIGIRERLYSVLRPGDVMDVYICRGRFSGSLKIVGIVSHKEEHED